jgi:hypothetical protein
MRDIAAQMGAAKDDSAPDGMQIRTRRTAFP